MQYSFQEIYGLFHQLQGLSNVKIALDTCTFENVCCWQMVFKENIVTNCFSEFYCMNRLLDPFEAERCLIPCRPVVVRQHACLLK